MAKKVIRTERGWAGHFICANRCLFRRNTLLQCGKTFIVVSTVGAMRNPDMREKEEFDTVGLDRYYETKVFHSENTDIVYHDMDVEREIFFRSPWSLNVHPAVADADNQANNMHEAVVREIMEKLLAGEIKP